ncbi:MAG TPA: alkaline phosphatase [Holosporales bacterium]|nr:alkaline phosphatase [Holosporales bacterium]
MYKKTILFSVLFSFVSSEGKTQESCLANFDDRENRIAIIGDYGHDGQGNGSARVAKLVQKHKPSSIITLGDNIYPDFDKKADLDKLMAKPYLKYLGAHTGAQSGKKANRRFYPTIGNHDVKDGRVSTYLSYFQPPGNGRYYDFVCGPVHFFSLNSALETDGNTEDSEQAQWLKEKLEASTAQFKVVYFHHPPYSSGSHGPSKHMRWPFKEWDVDVVLSGHEHNYERIERDGIRYVVNGLGGNPYIRGFKDVDPESVIRYSAQFGALFLTIKKESLSFKFITIDGKTIDAFDVKDNGDSA